MVEINGEAQVEDHELRQQTSKLIALTQQSGEQTTEIIHLTKNLEGLTQRLFWLGVAQVLIAIAVGTVGAVQLWAMLKGGA